VGNHGWPFFAHHHVRPQSEPFAAAWVDNLALLPLSTSRSTQPSPVSRRSPPAGHRLAGHPSECHRHVLQRTWFGFPRGLQCSADLSPLRVFSHPTQWPAHGWRCTSSFHHTFSLRARAGCVRLIQIKRRHRLIPPSKSISIELLNGSTSTGEAIAVIDTIESTAFSREGATSTSGTSARK